MAQRVTLAIPGPDGQDVNVSATNPIPVSGGGGGTAATPSIAGGEYNSTLPTLVNGGTDALQLDTAGNLRTLATASTITGADAVANTALTSYLARTETSLGTPRPIVVANYGFNGTSWDRDRKPNATSRIVSAAASTNATVAKASAGDLFRVTGFNANAAARYLKIYNKATAPTVGTDTPVWTEYLPAQARFELSFPKGYYLSAGISYALTTGVADADTGALTAADILGLNLAFA